ncbi:hypothetical protein TpMuguga_01g02790 [Theileria parva strain Muguga]|uniref:uncharacterized protein n=1 Tax=Theileria parva strain Muguga TaxID=333668 RepID=UPI001C62031F|nr:uncharacterized protein TpMuguga_01g02790 [Theileria parva strain Muguga]KAF5153474.1 hypothetical protein TpMuguga_01g02790 [Theileria parva strain Muguga]
MVEVYINNRRNSDLESQLTLNWNLDLPNNPNLCDDILLELERAVSKLEESNDFINKSLQESFDQELFDAVEENKLVIRRKKYQIEQVKDHLNNLKCSKNCN